MNRVVFHIIQQNTSVQYQSLQLLHSPQPNQIAFQTQKFPIFPITINMYLQNPPFNKIALAFSKDFCPNRIVIYGSENGLRYVKIKELTNLIDRYQQIVNIFENKIFFGYLKLSIQEPPKSKTNLCNQIKMKGIQLSMVNLYQCRFVCSLKAKITYHPMLFRLLEVLQYKSLILKKENNKIYQKYERRLQQILKLIDNKKIDINYPSQEVIKSWNQQISYLESEPIHYDNFVELPDPIKTKKDILKLQKQLQSFSVDRLGKIKPAIQDYFRKYAGKQIKQSYLRQLSSHEQDHNKALVSFWNQIKKLTSFVPQMQEAILMFFNYYLQFEHLPLKVSALKVLILFNKNNPNPKNQNLDPTYARVLSNIIKFLHLKQDQQCFQLSLKCCYMLYDKISNSSFVGQLLNAFKDFSLTEKLQKLQILQKITFRGVQIYDKREAIDFLVDILLQKQISLTEKNRAYNVAAYLASIFGKQVIMKDFEKLNTMITMTMQKNIDAKLGKIKKTVTQANQQQSDYSCEFCGINSAKFKDENLYDLHKAKECKYITNCRFCSQNVQIPQLFKHYIEKCTHKHQFKHCEDCFEVIQLKQQENHNKICTKKLQTKCPLCYEKVSSKLKLKQHLLVQGCPNNSK